METRYVLDVVKAVAIIAVSVSLFVVLILSLFNEKLWNFVISFFVLASPLIGILLMWAGEKARERR